MENVKVQSGEYVDKGYHMFSYRNTNIEEQVASLEEEIADIEENIKELQTNSTENKDQILYLNNKVKETKAEMDELKSKVVTNVYAPFSGEIHIETNTRSSEETEMTRMLDTKEYYLEGLISEQDYAKVNVGSATDIYLFSTKESRRGTITFMSKRPESTLDEESKNSNLSKYRVKISFSDQSNLVNGYHAQAKIDMDNKEIKIPTTAIITEDEKFYVLVDEMGVAKKREVVTSFAETDAMAIIESGLSENEVIVENVKTSKVKDGDNLYSSSLEF
jgi:HlyD family secretion protein